MDFLITVHRVNVITNDQFNSQVLMLKSLQFNIELPLKSLQFTEVNYITNDQFNSQVLR